MHYPYTVPIWKKAPFTRLLIPLIIGIVTEWYLKIPLNVIAVGAIACTIGYLACFLFPLGARFKLHPIQGCILNLLLLTVGLAATWQKDIRNSRDWYGLSYQENDMLVARIDEPLVDKAKSTKAVAVIESVVRKDDVINCRGKILLYFSKNTTGKPCASDSLKYGDKILIRKSLQRMKNSGNPGAFDYERYAAFQQLFHNVFLKDKDWVKLDDANPDRFKQFIITARETVLSALRKHIDSGNDELGLAEALLIGYTNDLDKDLVQAYSNTGVVHIIAISGMHLALIYLLLVGIFKKIPGLNRSPLLQVILILSCLWLFSLLTGASASVIRAAVMFSFITIGDNLKKRSSIFNSLAASAFVILCYNPFLLWDVGFQLSYLAVISIILFQKPVYNCWYIENKWGKKVWELAAVSLSAQILTFPVCIYYFHQFPNYFLLTNIIAVPLSSIILYAEIGLVATAWMPVVGPFMGKIVTWLVWLMNKVILLANQLPFAVWESIPATLLSTFLLYVAVIAFSAWTLRKNAGMLRIAVICLVVFTLVNTYEKWQVKTRQQLIVYNIPQHRAVEFTNGGEFIFIGDSVMERDASLKNYNLKPARIALQLINERPSLNNLFQQKPFYLFNNKTILLVDQPLAFKPTAQKTGLDVIILSNNSISRIAELASVFDCRLYVFDASNSLWKIDKWQKECEELHLRSYSVPQKGAFVFDAEQ